MALSTLLQSKINSPLVEQLTIEINLKSEGSKPIFARDEILQATHSPDKYESKYEPKYEPNEHERIVIVDNRTTLREGSRYASPGRYEPDRFEGPSTSRDTRYNGSEEYRPTRGEYDRPTTSYDQRESLRTERPGGDLRLQLEYRHDSSRYSVEGGRGQDHRAGSSSDLRARLVEKRTDRHDDRSYVERERRPSPDDRRRPSEFHEPEMKREPRGEYEGRRPPGEYEARRPHGESSSRRPRGEFETRVSRTESSSRRPPRDMEPRRRRSREEQSPEQYHGDPDEEYEQQREWDSNPEHVPRGGLYFEHDNREDDIHMSERGRGRGMSRMRGGTYRGRGQRGGPMMRGGSTIRGVRMPFRGAPYPRGFPPARMPRRGYLPRSGRKSSPKWEHDMFDTLSDQPAN